MITAAGLPCVGEVVKALRTVYSSLTMVLKAVG